MRDHQPLQAHGEQLTVVGLDAAICGTVDDCVARFGSVPTAAGTQPLASFCTFLDDAESGSRFKLTRRGVYQVEFAAPYGGDAAAVAGISVDAPGSSLNRNPTILLTGVVASDVWGGANELGLQYTLKATATVRVTQADAATSSAAIVRCQLGSGNATPVGVDPTLCYCRITRVGDLNDES